MGVALPKTVKTHKLPRLIWAAKSSRGASFFHPSHFARYTSFTASQPRKNGRCLAKNSQNTQFATFNLGCKKFARRELFSSQPFPTLHVFYGVPISQKWPLPGQKQCKQTTCHVLFGLQKVRAAQIFFFPAILNATRLLWRPSHAKSAVAWPKTVKTHNLPRLTWAVKNSRGANFFHLSHFPLYTSFTASQPRKNGRCLAKNSQNTQFATFNLGCIEFARRELFPSQPICTLHVFYVVPTTQKWPLPGQKQSKNSNYYLLERH